MSAIDLKKYLRSTAKDGLSKASVRMALLDKGWKPEEIDVMMTNTWRRLWILKVLHITLVMLVVVAIAFTVLAVLYS